MKFKIEDFKQVVLIGEKDGDAWIDWDTKSIEEAIKLTESALAYLKRAKYTKKS